MRKLRFRAKQSGATQGNLVVEIFSATAGSLLFVLSLILLFAAPSHALPCWKILGCTKVSITTTSLSDGATNQPYAAALTAMGGKTPYKWSITTGALPVGLVLNSGGAIGGTPATAGTSGFTTKVADAAMPVPNTQSLSLSITIAAAPIPPLACTASLPSGQATIAYSGTISCTGGTKPYSFVVTAGTLPTGLALNSTTGVISGTPTLAGTFTFTITITDSTIAQEFKMNVTFVAAGNGK